MDDPETTPTSARDAADALTLRSPALEVLVTPARGADVRSVREREGGRELLLQLPADARREEVAENGSLERFLADYRGGWQLLCPNGGEEREGPDGMRWAAHGEAWAVPWTVEESDPARVRCTVRLSSAPLALERVIALDGATLRVEQRVRNLGERPLMSAWGEHPAFGAPLVGPGCRLATNARRLAPVPGFTAPDDLARFPDPDGPVGFLGTLTAFDGPPWASLRNPRVGLGVELRWSADPLRHAWLWQEQGATTGWPWYGEVDVVAIEPVATPADGDPRRDGVRLAPGDWHGAWVELTVESFPVTDA